jgi:hypothetical protein
MMQWPARRTGTRVPNVAGSKTWSGWYFVDLLSMVVRNCLANCSSLMFASARRCSSMRRRLWRRAKAASVLVVLRRRVAGSGECRGLCLKLGTTVSCEWKQHGTCF